MGSFFQRGHRQTAQPRREMMAARGLDALLVTNEENFQYFTGATGSLALHYSSTRPAVLVFPLVGEPIAIVGAMITDSIRMSTYVSDARGYTDVLSFPVHMVLDAISGLAPAVKRIGVSLGWSRGWAFRSGTIWQLSIAPPR